MSWAFTGGPVFQLDVGHLPFRSDPQPATPGWLVQLPFRGPARTKDTEPPAPRREENVEGCLLKDTAGKPVSLQVTASAG